MGSRSDSTSRVTAAAAVWLWGQGSRIIVAEVGLTRGGKRLVEPWGARYRVDLASNLGSKTHINEVKGTRADLVREDLADGKWILPYHDLCPWLAIDGAMSVPEIDEKWGILQVHGHRVRVVRKAREVDDDHRVENLRVLASVLCMQSLPTMMGLSHAGQMAALETDGFDRPWRRWTHKPAPCCEEPGHIL